MTHHHRVMNLNQSVVYPISMLFFILEHPMRTFGNILWFIFGGFFIAMEYVIASVLLFITIIGIPFGIQSLKMASLAIWPFGKEVKTREVANNGVYVLMNLIWILIGGLWICISHLILGALLFITIIGIPFAKQHFKLAALSFTPFGREIVYKTKNE